MRKRMIAEGLLQADMAKAGQTLEGAGRPSAGHLLVVAKIRVQKPHESTGFLQK